MPGKKVREKVLVDTPRQFKVLQQLLCISAVDFEKKSLLGYTELTIIPLKSELEKIFLNCGWEVRIYRVTVDDFEAKFNRRDPMGSFLSENDKERRDLKFFSEKFYQTALQLDSDQLNGGELEIEIPFAVVDSVQEFRALKIGLEFSLDRPSTGVHFVTPGRPEAAPISEESGTEAREEHPMHMFTYRSKS